ncbi:MAG TPA: hypothetical protein VKO67_06185, partial [Smithellaceae bacterium]|nr:hypothetical protein [Smithellaceae bacterium]
SARIQPLTALLSEDVKENRQDDADDQAGRNRKVKTESLVFDGNIAGHFAQKRNVIGKEKSKSGNDENAT